MDVEDENISTLMAMGFLDIDEIKRALRLAKNDLNEAVAILTEQPVTPYGKVVDLTHDVDMKEDAGNQATTQTQSNDDQGTTEAMNLDEGPNFPETHLYELESRVFTDQWSIPYKKEESLWKCLMAAIRMTEEETWQKDSSCLRFLESCMPEAFKKLLNTNAVRRWNFEIQRGIYNMLELFMDLLVAQLKTDTIPTGMLNTVFSLACDLDCEWNCKNKTQLSEDKHWEALFGRGESFARSPENLNLDPYGWLVDLLNHFASKNGFHLVGEIFKREHLDSISMAALLRPFANCAELLNEQIVPPIFSPCVDRAVCLVNSLEDKDLRDKDIGAVLDLLVSLKLLCRNLWPHLEDKMINLRLGVILRMLKTPHFSTRMNALKEVSRLVEDAESTVTKKSSIPSDKLAEWMSSHHILSVALEGNIDHAQYSDRIKGLVEFLGPRLTCEELSQIWALGDKSFHVVDNLHGVLAAAAPKLGPQQFDHLLHLVHNKWDQCCNDGVREKLLSFLGQLGKECRILKMASKVLEAIWDVARTSGLSSHLVEYALDEHLKVMSEAPSKDSLRRNYVERCIEDIKKGSSYTLPVLRHLLNIASSITKGTGAYHKPDKAALTEWNTNHEIIKLLTSSLTRSHAQAVAAAKAAGSSLSHETVLDTRLKYQHGQMVQVHLDLLSFLLKQTDLYLPWIRCKEIWETLVTNPEACHSDKECCFEWFNKCLGDLVSDTQSCLFKEKLLKYDPALLSLTGFECLKAYFESVNVAEGKLNRSGDQTVIDRTDPVGYDYFWQIALESPDEDLAQQAMDHILNISYIQLSPRLKKDPAALHKKFITDCYKRLEQHLPCNKSKLGSLGSSSVTAIPSIAVSQINSLPTAKKAACQQIIRRLLELAERYISIVEECYPVTRSILPHGASFRGEPVCLKIKAEDSKTEFDIQAHNHETVWSVKQRIATVLRTSPDVLVVVIGDRPSPPGRDQCLLCRIDGSDKQTWVVKTSGVAATVATGTQLSELKENWDELPNVPSPGASGTSAAAAAAEAADVETGNDSAAASASAAASSSSSSALLSYHMEEEKSLPGVMMASGTQVFGMLYQLSEIEDPKIQEAIRRLLHLIPTDPSVVETLDKVISQRGGTALFSGAPSVARSYISALGSSGAAALCRASSAGNIPGASTPSSGPSKSGTLSSSAPRTSSMVSSLRTGSFRRNMNVNPTVGESTPTKEQSAQKNEDMLQALLDPSAATMSPFRVLYNLEVLSSKLMPTVSDATTAGSAQLFRREFLKGGGLHLVFRVLRKDFFSADVHYDLRQSCCLIALQLARFLLCGQSFEPDPSVRKTPSKLVSPTKLQTTPVKMIKTQLSPIKKGLSPIRDNPESAEAATKVLQTLSETEFLDMTTCLVRVCWTAAAGKLQATSGGQESKRSTSPATTMLFGGTGRRSRQSSSGSSSCSSGSGANEGEGTNLHVGICAQQERLSNKDMLIACEALELLVTCLELRGAKELHTFYNMSLVKDFVIDILIGCVSEVVRDSAYQQFYRLSLAPPVTNKHSLTQILVKTAVPLWVPSCSARGASQKLAQQCSQYFQLRCSLLADLGLAEQRHLGIGAAAMLNDEIAWLANFSPSSSGNDNDTTDCGDNTLLAGHLNLARGLLSCEGVNRREVGRSLLPDLLDKFLFPASKLIAEGLKKSSGSFNPKCSNSESRLAAYALMVELGTNCKDNLDVITKKLLAMHHRFNPDLAKEFEYEPAVEGRAPCNYVGLKNAGATCYMNSVIQQLFLVPGMKDSILAIEDEESDEDTIFHQYQMVLGHLQDSKLQYYTPEKFWRCLRLRGQPVNVREQQDSFEFFTHLVDSIDEHLNKIGKEKLFQKVLGGIFSDQKICKECPHRYERQEIFLALNLTVKSHNLVESLDQFVKGEILEGDNAYFCEECGVKRSAVKRMCIKTLPSTLVIQLKRFYYDWDAGRSLKFDDYFQFPWVLDMAPYTAEGIQEREKSETVGDSSIGPVKSRSSVSLNSSTALKTTHNYELVGVVVHSGQASAGHYYSFIKERKVSGTESKNRWLKFNDTSVEVVDMNDSTLEAECFGGTYKAKPYDSTSGFPEIRQRYWNGYILFYDRVEDPLKTPRTPRKGLSGSVSGIVTRSKSFRKSSVTSLSQRDSLSQLSELINHGERQGLFGSKMPARVQRAVREENLCFMRSRDVYCPEYYQLIWDTCQANATSGDPQFAPATLNLALNFLCNTYLRVKGKEASQVAAWVDLLDQMTQSSAESATWMMNYWASDEGLRHLRPFLLECPTRSVRHHFSRLLERSVANFFLNGGSTSDASLTKLLEALLAMLDKDVPDNCKTCTRFFYFLAAYSQMGAAQCQHLFSLNAFHKLLIFLLGPDRVVPQAVSPPPTVPQPTAPNQDGSIKSVVGRSGAIPLPAPSPTSTLQRRWSPSQTKDFADLHVTLANMILNCNLQEYRTTSEPSTLVEGPLALPAEVSQALYGQSAPFYLQDVVTACCMLTNVDTSSAVVRMLLYVSHSNRDFSRALLREALHQCAAVSAVELKNLGQLLQELLAVEDTLQFERIQYAVDGFTDKDGVAVEGTLALIRSQQTSDSRRAYQLMKFLVSLTSRMPMAKDYMLQAPLKWQWTVNWLKQKLEQPYWSPQSDLSNEESNTRNFQRTTSAQVTLEEATALLTEFESSDMETETDADFGLGPELPSGSATAEEDASSQPDTAKRSKCYFNLGSPQ